MRRRSPVNLEVKHDRWLVSYSDFVTLLFAFFVVMYSISQVSEGKYRVLSSTLLDAFSVPQSAINPVQVGDPTRTMSPSTIETPKPGQEQLSSEEVTADLSKLTEQVNREFIDLINDNLMTVSSNELWLQLELNSNILFPTASADPSLQAKGIFEEIATMFADYNNSVQVEGFTDDIPINNRRFNSNWELSAARAASVVKLLANNGIQPERLAAVGRGEFQPVADNSTAEGRAKNRRVVVMLARQASLRPQISAGEVDSVIAEPAIERTEDPPTQVQQPLIEPLELNNGGLLFSSDPDLPRNNSPAQTEESQ